MLTHFSLFSGIGGIDLAAEWAGFKSVGQCEFADYPTKVLEKHWPDVPRWRDIRDVTLESVRDRGIRTVDIISGGFPCQPFSQAGKQRGKEDDRYLWPEMLRVISEIKPTWVLGENVAGLINMALDQVLTDLESQGYTTLAFNIPAAAVNAPHRRERIFIVAYSNSSGHFHRKSEKQTKETREHALSESIQCSSDVAYTECEGLEGHWQYGENGKASNQSPGVIMQSSCEKRRSINQWKSEPDVGRVVNGIPSRVDRLKCLGNAVVPQQVYPILKAIAEIEMKGE